jgi:hypothetical protein
MLVECDDSVTVHKFCSMLPAFEFQARPVTSVEDAVKGELEVIAWCDGLRRKYRWGGLSWKHFEGGAESRALEKESPELQARPEGLGYAPSLPIQNASRSSLGYRAELFASVS